MMSSRNRSLSTNSQAARLRSSTCGFLGMAFSSAPQRDRMLFEMK